MQTSQLIMYFFSVLGDWYECVLTLYFMALFEMVCCRLQDSETLLSLSRSEGGAISLSLGLKAKRLPSSPFLLIHFHGGGFVAQTSKSHEVRRLPLNTFTLNALEK